VRAQAWAPGHATLVFAAPNSSDTPEQKGSLGIGLNFEAGVLTEVKTSTKDAVFWNSSPIDGKVSLTALTRFREITGIREPIEINHYSELKIGHGLSTSGAGALGVALALDKVFSSNLSTNQLYLIAHYADIINHTGLGSVMGQITGGIEIRTIQGGPGIGDSYSIPDQSEIVILMLGSLQTSDVLVSQTQMNKVNKAGIGRIEELSQKKQVTLRNILQLGRSFTEECGLMTPRVENLLNRLDKLDEHYASMAMIGETVIILPKNRDNIIEFAKQHKIAYVVTKITNNSPSIVDLEE